MAKNQRRNYSLPPDVIEVLESNEDRGERSAAVADALREYYEEL